MKNKLSKNTEKELPEHIWRVDFEMYYCEECEEKIEGRDKAFLHPEICKGSNYLQQLYDALKKKGLK